MRTKRILSIVLALVLLASALPLAITSAAAYEKKIPCDADGNNELTKEELVNVILPYMLGEGSYTLDDVGDAAWVYAYWDGKPKTIVDSAGRTVTIYKPVKRIAMMNGDCMPIMRAIHATDKIVAVNKYTIQDEILYPEFSDYPNIGSVWSPNYEALLAAKPDTVILYGTIFKKKCTDIENKLKEVAPDVTTIWLDGYKPGLTPKPGAQLIEESRELGYLLDREEEAEEWIGFYEGIMDSITEKVGGIENKTRVYLECWKTWYTAGPDAGWGEKLKISGGENIFSDISGYKNIDPGAVLYRNPEAIIWIEKTKGGYDTGDLTELSSIRDEIMERLNTTTAAKNGKVFIINTDVFGGTEHFIGIAYVAKWLYPANFTDLKPEIIHKQYLTEFQRLSDSLVDNGVFVYPGV